MKFEEWFIAQHGPRSNSHLKEFADERLADWIKQGQDAERELRDRGTWDLQFTAALRAWAARLPDDVAYVLHMHETCNECGTARKLHNAFLHPFKPC